MADAVNEEGGRDARADSHGDLGAVGVRACGGDGGSCGYQGNPCAGHGKSPGNRLGEKRPDGQGSEVKGSREMSSETTSAS